MIMNLKFQCVDKFSCLFGLKRSANLSGIKGYFSYHILHENTNSFWKQL